MVTKKLTHEDLLARLNALGSGILPLEEYKGSKTKIKWRCVEGHEWDAIPCPIMRGKSGCPYCAGNRQLTRDEFIHKLKDLRGGEVSLLGGYTKSTSPTTFYCHKHEEEFVGTAEKVLKGSGCRSCAKNYQHTREEIVKRLEVATKGEIVLIGEFTTVNTPTRFCCTKEGHSFSTQPSNILNNGTRCPLCRLDSRRQTKEEIERRLLEKGTPYTCVGEYRQTNVHTLWKCFSCSNTWRAIATSLLQGKGCPHCARKYKQGFYIAKRGEGLKIGVSKDYNTVPFRVSRQGIPAEDILLVLCVEDAIELESFLLARYKENKVPTTEKFDGYTEVLDTPLGSLLESIAEYLQ